MESVESEALLRGTLTSSSGRRYDISMAKVYWDALSWLIENEDTEGDVLSVIEALLPAAAREGYGDRELVEGVLAAMLNEIYGEQR